MPSVVDGHMDCASRDQHRADGALGFLVLNVDYLAQELLKLTLELCGAAKLDIVQIDGPLVASLDRRLHVRGREVLPRNRQLAEI